MASHRERTKNQMAPRNKRRKFALERWEAGGFKPRVYQAENSDYVPSGSDSDSGSDSEENEYFVESTDTENGPPDEEEEEAGFEDENDLGQDARAHMDAITVLQDHADTAQRHAKTELGPGKAPYRGDS